MHQAKQRRPIDHAVTRQKTGITVANAYLVARDQRVADLINPPPSGSTKHLVDLVRLERDLEMVPPIRVRCERHAAEGKIDPSRQAHRGHHDS